MELTSRRSIVVFLSTPRKTTRKDVLSEHPAKPGDAERERSEEDHGRRREKERSRLLEIEHVFFQKGKSPLDCSDAIGDDKEDDRAARISRLQGKVLAPHGERGPHTAEGLTQFT